MVFIDYICVAIKSKAEVSIYRKKLRTLCTGNLPTVLVFTLSLNSR